MKKEKPRKHKKQQAADREDVKLKVRRPRPKQKYRHQNYWLQNAEEA